MNSSHRSSFATTARSLRAALAILGLALAPLALAPYASAQGIISSSMTGIVTDSSGKALAGVNVTARHEPTGTTYTATTNASGRFSYSGMVVGGPYTVTATSAGVSAKETEVVALLGTTIDVNLKATAAEIVTLQAFKVKGEANDLDSGASGAASVITSSTIANTASVQRSFADVARTTSFVSLRGVLGSRSQPIISAVGQNNRFNSIQVDGARINDQFGLNGSGLQAFGNPISLDTIEQFNVSVSPYDVSQSGFTGASITAVTKSGTNQYHGSAYYYYTNDDLQARNVFGSTAGTRALLEQKTKGFTLGGPILKDRLFFFLNYEKFDSISPEISGLIPTGTPQGTADFAAINARLAAIKASAPGGSAYDFGTFLGSTATISQFNEISLAKLDWNITNGQRFSVRYSKTEGELPASGRYTLTNFGSIGGSGITAAPFATNLSSNRFVQVRSEEVWAGQLFSQWTPDFKTQLRYAQNEYSQATPTTISFPEVRIFGVGGIGNTGATVTNGSLVLGTEQNRQGNFVAVKTKSFSGSGEYLFNQWTLTGGFDREQSDFVNLFRSNSYGVFDYASVADFTADLPRAYSRSFYVTGTPPDDVSDFAINGLFGQARWNVSSRLNATFGVRYDYFTADKKPPTNTGFKTAFGVGNDGSVDGSNAVSPRVSFNYAVDENRTTQFRGGVGHFVGRVPWVIVSNSWSNSGVGRSQITNAGISAAGIPTLSSYLSTSFDPKNPIGTAASVNVGNPVINLIEDKLSPPSVWRGNFAIDRKIALFDSTITLEGVQTYASEALFIRDLNIRPRFVGSDGRQVFAGAASNQANVLRTGFANVYAVSNINEGESTYISLTLARQMKNRWSYSAAYTNGQAKDALPLGETVAASQFGRNPVFNQNQVEVARSAFEVKHRIQVSLAREFELRKNWKTTVSLYYEGRTGNPFTYVYGGNDVNGDGVNNNELVYVPTGTTDPVLAALNPTVAQSIMTFVDAGELARFKGRIAPRHAFTMPWINRLDLHVGQKIPLFKTMELEVFADFVNFGSWFSKKIFGYTEVLPGAGDNELLTTKLFGGATYTAAGQLQMTGTSFTAPAIATPNNELSRWRMQFGARLRF